MLYRILAVCLSYVFPISFSDLACSVAGITSDANVLTNQLRLIAQRYYESCYIIFFQALFIVIRIFVFSQINLYFDINWTLFLCSDNLVFLSFRYLLQFQEPIPCEQVVSSLCDVKQAYTQFGGKFQRFFTGTRASTINCFLYKQACCLIK